MKTLKATSAALLLSAAMISSAGAQAIDGARGGGQAGAAAGARVGGGSAPSVGVGGNAGAAMRAAPSGATMGARAPVTGGQVAVNQPSARGGVSVDGGARIAQRQGNWQGNNWQANNWNGNWRDGRRWRSGPTIGFGIGFGPSYYNDSYYYGDSYAYYDEPYYSGATTYYTEPGGGDVNYCIQRFKSYDVTSGTYLGYDGMRHPCP